ncbi:hypothetical protein HK096_000355 [Nowakowskiella sp. JEL0078]|nr:hypothetical protein HK096_000355 [Nowakowskiella sp. JEL0078]
MMTTATDISLKFGVINADGSNRHEKINTQAVLVNELFALKKKLGDVPFLSISELGKKSAQAFIDQLYHCGSDGHVEKLAGGSSDHIVTSWPETFSLESVHFSNVAKYSMKVLVRPESDTESDLRLGFASLYFPHKCSKERKKKITDLLGKAALDVRDEVNAIVFNGDFNTPSKDLAAYVEDWDVTVKLALNGETTTAKGGKGDNVLFSEELRLDFKDVHTSYELLSHHPFRVDLK